MITTAGWVFMGIFLGVVLIMLGAGLVLLARPGMLARSGGAVSIVLGIMGVIGWLNIMGTALEGVPR